jgi:hypothetical protein
MQTLISLLEIIPVIQVIRKWQISDKKRTNIAKYKTIDILIQSGLF